MCIQSIKDYRANFFVVLFFYLVVTFLLGGEIEGKNHPPRLSGCGGAGAMSFFLIKAFDQDPITC